MGSFLYVLFLLVVIFVLGSFIGGTVAGSFGASIGGFAAIVWAIVKLVNDEK
jgi:hypothetical protein